MSWLFVMIMALCVSMWGTCWGVPTNIVYDATTVKYRLSQSVTGLNLWTTSPSDRLTKDQVSVPSVTQSFGIQIDAAKQEFEPFQVVIAPTSTFTSVSAQMSAFTLLGSSQVVTIQQALFATSTGPTGKYVTDTFASGPSFALSSTAPTVLWITVFVPGTATAGTATATLTLTTNSGVTVTIPVSLKVWNWVMPKTPHFSGIYEGLPNTDCGSDMTCYDRWKSLYLDLRMAPETATWPSALLYNGNYGTTWDCSTLSDEPNMDCAFSGGCTTQRYGLGKGGTWNGKTYTDWVSGGFDNLQVLKFQSNSLTRPNSFCGQTLAGNQLGPKSYNTQWGKMVKALETYLKGKSYNGVNLIDKSYYYTQNEPQDATAYNVSALLCWLSKDAAPSLKVAVSKQPLKQIAENPECGCGYDIWIAYAHYYEPHYTQFRQAQYPAETVWIYSLDGDGGSTYPLAYSPSQGMTSLNYGMHYRVIPWVHYSLRVRGWGYYAMGVYFDAAKQPKMGAILLREAFEDYEYFYKANGNAHPAACSSNPVDATIRSIGTCVTSWRNDPSLLKVMRNELGKFINGERSDLPKYQVMDPRPSGNYYINFGNPNVAWTPYNWNGKLFDTVIGWSPYDPAVGYGWCGQYIGNTGIHLYNTRSSGNPVQQTSLYNDYGRYDVFHYAIQNGVYNVTVGLGWYGASRADKSFLDIEGIVAYDATVKGPLATQTAISQVVEVTDGTLSLGVGVYNQYTMLSYLMIEPSSKVVTKSCKNPGLPPRKSATCSYVTPLSTVVAAVSESATTVEPTPAFTMLHIGLIIGGILIAVILGAAFIILLSKFKTTPEEKV
eukprot:TRINITY_DN4131_c0_g1_i1.p1 TRINITY_DN4131_c0_g1~~TRINITY_DN4131_c0_g1_i1.p1  ORF type:complete len:829 (-),score=102.69 TRINITY_DN4131_c0_g1_i1:51-2537(-)